MNWLSYGAREYDPSIGRFFGVDPIAEDFAHVTPYNYAENRVPNGIDLYGLQFVSQHSALFSISKMQTWANTNSVHSGTDNLGREYIGTSVPVSLTKFNVPEPGNKDITGTGKAMRELQASMDNAAAVLPQTKLGLPDRRFKATKLHEKKMRGAGRVGLAMEAINLAQDVYNTVDGMKSLNEFNEQQEFVSKSWQGVADGINNGLFSADQITVDNLSAVAIFLYQGTSINDPALQKVADNISMNILKNFRPTVIYRASGLDNFQGQTIIIEPMKSNN